MLKSSAEICKWLLIFVIFVLFLGSEFPKPENKAKNKYLAIK